MACGTRDGRFVLVVTGRGVIGGEVLVSER